MTTAVLLDQVIDELARDHAPPVRAEHGDFNAAHILPFAHGVVGRLELPQCRVHAHVNARTHQVGHRFLIADDRHRFHHG
ncbi:hypothetical protein D3C71_1256090 [compost metagenome]